MVYNTRAPGERIQVATEVVFKTVLATEKKYSPVLVGRHEPEGRYLQISAVVCEAVRHAVDSLRGRRISTPPAHAAHLRGMRIAGCGVVDSFWISRFLELRICGFSDF